MISLFMVHTVQVRTKLGEGSYGPVYGDEVSLSGVMVDETTRLVRTPSGAEVTSTTTIFGPLSAAAALAVGSRVTLPSGDVTTVLSRSSHALPGLGLPEHVEAACA